MLLQIIARNARTCKPPAAFLSTTKISRKWDAQSASLGMCRNRWKNNWLRFFAKDGAISLTPGFRRRSD
jgi:hypothetical protein